MPGPRLCYSCDMKTVWSKRIAIVVLSSTVFAPAVLAGDCTCRAKGVVAVEGEVACISTPQGRRLARCQKVLNNTSWDFMEESCGEMFTQPAESEREKSRPRESV